MIDTLYTNVDLILKKQKATSGDFYEVDDLSYQQVNLYIGEMIFFEGLFYIVVSKTTETLYKRSSIVKCGKKTISKEI